MLPKLVCKPHTPYPYRCLNLDNFLGNGLFRITPWLPSGFWDRKELRITKLRFASHNARKILRQCEVFRADATQIRNTCRRIYGPYMNKIHSLYAGDDTQVRNLNLTNGLSVTPSPGLSVHVPRDIRDLSLNRVGVNKHWNKNRMTRDVSL